MRLYTTSIVVGLSDYNSDDTEFNSSFDSSDSSDKAETNACNNTDNDATIVVDILDDFV